MNAILVITTLLSLAAACVLGWMAWRMARDERQRSEARVAALAAIIESDPLEPADLGASGAPASEGGALAASPVAPSARWDAASFELADPASPAIDGSAPPAGRGGMFSTTHQEPSTAPRRLVAVGLVAAVLVAGVALTWTTARALAPTASIATAQQPLELLSLTSARRGQELVVAGLVRNPRASAKLERLTAVVLFFDERGGFLTSSRAPLDFQTLAPGDESPFQLTVVEPEGTSRYRVSFRYAEGGVVPHVDRRARGATERAADTSARARQAGL